MYELTIYSITASPQATMSPQAPQMSPLTPVGKVGMAYGGHEDVDDEEDAIKVTTRKPALAQTPTPTPIQDRLRRRQQ